MSMMIDDPYACRAEPKSLAVGERNQQQREVFRATRATRAPQRRFSLACLEAGLQAPASTPKSTPDQDGKGLNIVHNGGPVSAKVLQSSRRKAPKWQLRKGQPLLLVLPSRTEKRHATCCWPMTMLLQRPRNPAIETICTVQFN